MRVETDHEGLERISVTDEWGDVLSVQMGRKRNGLYFSVLLSDAHLNHAQVAELVDHLHAWLATGSFVVKPQSPEK